MSRCSSQSIMPPKKRQFLHGKGGKENPHGYYKKGRTDLVTLGKVESVKEPFSKTADNALVRNASCNTVQSGCVSALLLDLLASASSLIRLHKLFLNHNDQISDEFVNRSRGGDGKGDVDRRRRLESIEMPAQTGHAVRNVIDINRGIRRRERDHADHRLSKNLQRPRKDRVFPHSTFKLPSSSNDLVAAFLVSGLSHGHQAGPASGNQRTRAGTGHGRASVNTSRPVGQDEVLVAAQLAAAVQNYGVTLGGKSILVGINADTCHAWLAEIEATLVLVGRRETGTLEESNDKRTKTAVDVEGNLVSHGKAGERRDIVNQPVRVVWRRADEEDSIRVDETTDGWDMDFVMRCWTWHNVKLYAEILRGLHKGSVRGNWDDPTSTVSTTNENRWRRSILHFRLGHAALSASLLAGRQTCHQD